MEKTTDKIEKVIGKDLSYVDISKLKQFTVANTNGDESVMPDKVVEEFLNNYKEWKEVVGYMVEGSDGERLYGAALCNYSSNLYSSNNISKEKVMLLKEELSSYEDNVTYMYAFKNTLYVNLVLCLHKLSLETDDVLKEYLKKAIYYSLAQENYSSYQIDCYAYRATKPHFIQSLKEETLSMSSPTTFNDPFDCPILQLLTMYGDTISHLFSEAYKECLKFTCFVKNMKLPSISYEENKKELLSKHTNDPAEYLNELMWAHYADNHKGVCVKYHFNNEFTKFADNTQRQMAYFRDIVYTSDMDVYRKNGAINLHDAFFTKGKSWEYENELRLLAFDPEGKDMHISIEAKNTIAAVYFGLKCSKYKKNEIIRIMKKRKWISERFIHDKNTHRIVTVKEEHPVEFFQMKIDEKQFAKLKAVRIEEI